MEAVIFEDSPLANYLQDEAGDQTDWTPATAKDDAPPSPVFAPRGRPAVTSKFRQRLPTPLRLIVPKHKTIAAIHSSCSRAVNSRLGRAENGRFLEQFRYLIVASRLLSDYAYINQSSRSQLPDAPIESPTLQLSVAGAVGWTVAAFVVAWALHWVRGGRGSPGSRRRLVLLFVTLAICGTLAYTYVRRQWLQYVRRQALAETRSFVAAAHELDATTATALTLIQEVELVSRGYRISTPLPPITRLEDRSQHRRCARLRKALRNAFAAVIPRYVQACHAMKPLAEQMDLEKYLDIYDINELDRQEAEAGYSDTEFDDPESIKVAKILAARFHTTRRLFLCCLLALDANGGSSDFHRWGIAIEELQATVTLTEEVLGTLRSILDETDHFPVPTTPKIPLTPGREKWRTPLRQLNSFSSGVRSLQAKLHVLREESDKTLNESEDISELGANLMNQYESIGADLRSLMQEWEDGRTALASCIDRNHKRLSSMSGVVSPAISLGGLTSVDEGSPTDALRALNGERPLSFTLSGSESEEIFEAIAAPRQRQRSTLTRDERIAKMKEDRQKRDSQRDQAEANTRMLRELESVINLRPRGKTSTTGRVTSL